MMEIVILQLKKPDFHRNVSKNEQKTESLIKLKVDLILWNGHMTYLNTTGLF